MEYFYVVDEHLPDRGYIVKEKMWFFPWYNFGFFSWRPIVCISCRVWGDFNFFYLFQLHINSHVHWGTLKCKTDIWTKPLSWTLLESNQTIYSVRHGTKDDSCRFWGSCFGFFLQSFLLCRFKKNKIWLPQ